MTSSTGVARTADRGKLLAFAGLVAIVLYFSGPTNLADRVAIRGVVGSVAAGRALGEPAAAGGRPFVGCARRRIWRSG